MKKTNFLNNFITILFSFLLLAIVGIGIYFMINDRQMPSLNLMPATEGEVALQKPFILDVADEKSGLKSLVITAKQNDKNYEVVNTSFDVVGASFLPGNFKDSPKTHTQEFSLENSGFEEGSFELEIKVLDASFASFFKGNENIQTFSFILDTKVPEITILTGAPNIVKGGSALISYKISEKVEKTGIQLGENFFPAYPATKDGKPSEDVYICLFAFPYDYTLESFQPQVFAEDKAGNITSQTFVMNLKDYDYPNDTVNLSDNFFKIKESEIRKIRPSDEDIVDLYVKVNSEVRVENAETILQVTKETSPTFYWTKSFIQQPRSAPRAYYGDSRNYVYKGKEIDYQTHLGLDLASVKEDIVRSTNKGKVIFADYLGIYGYTVIVDHGRGLHSLYGHCTQIHVKVGDEVDVNADLGTTGVTGLAVGDHVHLGFYIAGVPVQPLEWLDPVWVRNNITSRMHN